MDTRDQSDAAREGAQGAGAGPGSEASPRLIARTPKWLVLAKPAGWLSVPGRASPSERQPPPVLSEWAAREHGKVWVVHRLDRETSGVILFALSAEAHREANGWFSRHQARKAYDLLAQGTMGAPVARVNLPVEGAPSVTQIELKESFDGCFLARALPLSGRRHQIRVHLASRGNPLLGDPQYGGPRELPRPGRGPLRVERVALHAARLELPSREVFEAPWPEDFAAWVAALRGRDRSGLEKGPVDGHKGSDERT